MFYVEFLLMRDVKVENKNKIGKKTIESFGFYS